MEEIRTNRKNSFDAIPTEKRERIWETSLREFAEYGYTGASTNRMVEEIGISKGSLFHYFGTKRKLYIAILDAAAEQTQSAVEEAAVNLPPDPVERVIALARAEYGFYSRRPELYRLFRRALSDPQTALLVRERYSDSGMAMFFQLLEQADFGSHTAPERAITLLAWIVNGFNDTFRAATPPDTDPEETVVRYEQELREYLAVVAPCLTGAGTKPIQNGDAK